MKKIVKILAVVSLLAIATSTFSSCSVVRYNAKIYSDIGETILPSFRENSPIYNKYNMSAPESRSFIVADESTKTNLPGVFAVGDVRTKVLRQVVTAVSDGAVAAHYAEEYIAQLSE